MKKNFFKILISSLLIASAAISVSAESVRTVDPAGVIVEETEGSQGGSIAPFGITKDTEITGSAASGGRGDTTYDHYGSYQYDARAYFENIGNTTFTYELYTASGYLVYRGTLAPNKAVTLTLLQSILKWDLSDGKGTAKIYTSDGSTCKAYFRYNVLD